MADTYQILVVDDDFSIVNIIETALKQAGYQVLTPITVKPPVRS